jgi:hypothetical protein
MEDRKAIVYAPKEKSFKVYTHGNVLCGTIHNKFDEPMNLLTDRAKKMYNVEHCKLVKM